MISSELYNSLMTMPLSLNQLTLITPQWTTLQQNYPRSINQKYIQTAETVAGTYRCRIQI
jgi:hypothetical protein